MLGPDPSAFTRRDLLRHGLVLASAAVTLPTFLDGTARAMAAALGPLASLPGVPDDRILVVVQLSGGNDGLNTVVPFGMSEYYRARREIAIPEKDVLRLSGGDGLGLHPQLAPLKGMYDEGLLGVVQGVGYPNPNRSHFKSMDIWHTADEDAAGEGWLGRYIDSQCCGFGKGESGKAEPVLAGPNVDGSSDAASGPPGLAIGRTAPLALEGRLVRPVSFESAELFRWTGADGSKALREAYEVLSKREAGEGPAATPGSNAEFLVRTSLDAQVSSDLIRKAVAKKPGTTFPTTELGRQLSMVASMIRAGLKTRVYYVSHGSFDTHSAQGAGNGRHANLLGQWAQAMKAFYAELKAQGNDTRVMAMSFSEFGRRVKQNESQGTDHGTAAPMFLFGPMVRQGVIGEHPSLRDLDQGDLKHTIDFRSVYAGVLEGWLKSDAKAVLGGSWRALPVVRG
jgi:uncharacterized protein (DUF1501 family)